MDPNCMKTKVRWTISSSLFNLVERVEKTRVVGSSTLII